ncbi:MAG: hypothetical protein IGS49_04970 [Chlorogloeopsis fritschii C42_A2020_084]|uniref:hypothetical protein n=1 Tax=Chlorogloeopsis fritschii TaxID=1124 RepID=UPI0019F7C66C|nr:hypothetical protein [Chlorogloeopsis fritschii]MBF2004817.1 hypothetical protein [Chlorogloeopsis fritschii C42_A2020_084]
MLNNKQKLRHQTTQHIAHNFQSFEQLTKSEAEKVVGGLVTEAEAVFTQFKRQLILGDFGFEISATALEFIE